MPSTITHDKTRSNALKSVHRTLTTIKTTTYDR